MKGGERLALAAAVVLFAFFFANVALGAARMSVMLSDVGEMLVLFASCICFVIAILGLERKVRESRSTALNKGGDTDGREDLA